MKLLDREQCKNASDESMDLVPSFRESVFNSSVKDISMDLTELGIDTVLDDGVLSELPIAKTVLAVCKTGVAIRERNLVKQTVAFIQGFNAGNISEEIMKKYREKLEKNAEFAEDELGRVLILLDANVDKTKSVILGCLYNTYVKGGISWEKFCEYSEANRRMFVSDYTLLIKLRNYNLNLTNQDKYKIGRLVALGMVVEKGSPAANKTHLEKFADGWQRTSGKSGTYGEYLSHNDYQVTSFGEGFIQIVQRTIKALRL
ncbi:MAG: hypothetical protein IJN64_17730 [Lachnospiraceae bacterium]|nr:hypothetical protein [Lachnospiraceae bacterium]